MKTYIERKLIEMRQMRACLSVVIYYEEVGENRPWQLFVVELKDPFGLHKRFRSESIRKSLGMALKWLKNYRAV